MSEAAPEEASTPALADVRARHPSSGRSRTIPASRKLSHSEQKRRWDESNEWGPPGPRPKTRGDCAEPERGGGTRPCPWVACSKHLYLDVDPETGALKLNFPDLEVWQMKYTCALDEADAAGSDGMTLEQVAERTNLTRERVRQLEDRTRERVRDGALALDSDKAIVRLRVISGG